MKIYLAGSIFYYGDELRNREWAKQIREMLPGVDLYSPIENTDINGAEGKKKFAGSQLIEQGDNSRLDETDVLIACLDGDVIPAGTSCEIGIMREKIRAGAHKYVIGIATDNRECSRTHSAAKDEGGAADICESQYCYQNLYVIGCIKSSGVVVGSIDEALEFLKTIAHEFDQTVKPTRGLRAKTLHVHDDKFDLINKWYKYDHASPEPDYSKWLYDQEDPWWTHITCDIHTPTSEELVKFWEDCDE